MLGRWFQYSSGFLHNLSFRGRVSVEGSSVPEAMPMGHPPFGSPLKLDPEAMPIVTPHFGSPLKLDPEAMPMVTPHFGSPH